MLFRSIYFLIMKINNFRGELFDSSAKKEALQTSGLTETGMSTLRGIRKAGMKDVIT